jgi:AbrB family looped-hinge helix DNA binding protein
LLSEEEKLGNIVKVTRRGQTTIPVEFREKFGIKEGDQLMVEATEKGLLFKPIRKLEDCAGIYAKYGKVEEIKKEIDKLREEY